MKDKNRDRPARNPSGMVCGKCGKFFTGEDTHVFCAICVDEIAKTIATAQSGPAGR